MFGFTFRTLPFTNIESQRFIDISTDVASFRRGEKSVNLMDLTPIPHAFIFENIDEVVPPTVGDRFCKMMVSDHIADSKAFYMNSLVFANKLFACFMKKVFSLIGNLFVLSCKPLCRPVSICRPLLFSRDSTLKAFKLFLGLSQEFRWFNHFGIGSGKERFDTVIKPDFAAGIYRIGNINFAENRSIVFSRRCHRYGNRLLDAFKLPVQNYLDPTTFRDVEAVTCKRPVLWNGKGLLISLLLEMWELCAIIKKVIVSHIKVAKGLLQGLRIHVLKPFKFRILFKLRQSPCCIMVSQAFLFAVFIFSVVVNALTQKVVIDKANTTKMPVKCFSLLFIRIYSVFECFIYRHA